MFQNLLDMFNAYAKLNPVIASTVSLAFIGGITYSLKSVPLMLYNFLLKELTTTVTFNTAGDYNNVYAFFNFSKWFKENKWSNYSRTYIINNNLISTGYGNHLFIHKNRLCILKRGSENFTGSDKVVEYVTIIMLGRNKAILLDLADSFLNKNNEKLSCWRFDYSGMFNHVGELAKRELNTVIIEGNIKEDIVNKIKYFKNNKQWYIDRGIPYKLAIVLHGVPGTGKTSLIKAIANHFNHGVYLVNLSMVDDSTIENVFTKDRLIVIEDFDSVSAVKERKQNNNPNTVVINDKPRNLTLSGLLNSIDGIADADGSIIIMTTNVLDNIDPALLRKGRIDYIYEIKPLSDVKIKEYIKTMFPEYTPNDNVVFNDIVACNLQAIYFEYKEDLNGFIKHIPKRNHN